MVELGVETELSKTVDSLLVWGLGALKKKLKVK
jgi:hypothetical protein